MAKTEAALEQQPEPYLTALGAATHVGKIRTLNEDTFRVEPGLWLVADGMGGPGGGDIASQIAADTVVEEVERGTSLPQAFEIAHQRVIRAAGPPGMGTTMVAVQDRGDHAQLCWAGDSRAYLWGGVLKRLSRDHSPVQKMVDEGKITLEQAFDHPNRNMVTNVIGGHSRSSCGAETLHIQLDQGQKILLCSDGLHDELRDHQIATLLDRTESVEGLINAALDSGGNDNITAMLIGRADA